ncbi:MAG: cytochrome C assembly family protein [Woeseiaceae bacterium]
MSQITILLLYLLAAMAFTLHRLPAHSARSGPLLSAAIIFGIAGLLFHGQSLADAIISDDGMHFSIAVTLSLIALQLALIGMIGAVEASLRGMSAGLLALAAIVSAFTAMAPGGPGAELTWQIQAHILISMFAYGLLTVGAIVAVYALVQDRRLRSGKLSATNHLFAPLETTEKLLFGIAASGFAALLLAVVSGFAFVDNLFAQHLVHKTSLSLLALGLFGILVAGRQFAGWRGKRAVYLYLWGFFMLCLAYFGSRYVLEQVLGRTWG